jgi:hypothetical protein
MRGIDIAALALHAFGAVGCAIMCFACGGSFASDTYQDFSGPFRPNTTGMALAGGLDAPCYDDGSDRSAACVREGLPLFQAPGAYARWHPIALLAHFEFVSAAFSLLHVAPRAWGVCLALSLASVALFAPYSSGAAGLGEGLAMGGGSVAAASVFFCLRRTHELDYTTKVILRYAEYSITAPELIVAVMCIFIVDPPTLMAVAAFVLIGMCNLGGLQMHLALTAGREADAAVAYVPFPAETERAVRVPLDWVQSIAPAAAPTRAAALVNSGLADTCILYAAAMGLILYQGQLLLLTDPPWYVTTSVWFLLANYTAFGVWATVCYGLQWDDRTLDAGFGVLSPVAKVGIVSMLAFAFAFQSACIRA